MRVGKLLNKEIKDIPGIKNPYKVERYMSKEKRRKIEQNLLMKKYKNFSKNWIPSSQNIKIKIIFLIQLGHKIIFFQFPNKIQEEWEQQSNFLY